MTRGEVSPAVAARTVRGAAIVCAGLAAAAVVAFAVAGRPLSGGALATGLLLGSVNGFVAARFVNLPFPFAASSLLRILTLSMVGVGIGLAFGISNIWLVIIGLAGAQFVLAASALRLLVRR